MAISKKKKRPITVAGQEYFWAATGNDGYISLHVMVDKQGGQKLSCHFGYHHEVKERIGNRTYMINQFVITPYTVRQVILYALQQGWTPLAKRPLLELGAVDDKIDLRFSKNKADIIKSSATSASRQGNK